jgi:hypothetical protein
MRGFLAILAMTVVFSAAALWFAGPPLAEGFVRLGLEAAGFEGDDLEVKVEAGPTRLLGGGADSLRIRARHARLGDLSAVQLDLTLLDVRLLERTASDVRGRLDGVEAIAADGSVLPIASVDLGGPLDAATARLRVTSAALEGLVARLVGMELGASSARVRLAPPDEVTFEIAGLTVRGRLSISPGGDLVLGVSGGPSIRVLDAGDVEPMRLSGLAAGDGGLVLLGTLDVGSMLP